MSVINYSKWDHIEVSDDEDDTHPNIDTPSLFRWRHTARLEREAAFKEEKVEFDKKYSGFLQQLAKCKRDLTEAKKNNSSDVASLQSQLDEMTIEEKKWKDSESEMQKKERLQPWNIDSICHDATSKTVINKAVFNDKPESEEDSVTNLMEFVKKHDPSIKTFGLTRKPADSEKYLLDNTDLVCDHTANQLVLWCIDLAVEEKFDLMEHVSHQCIVLQFMLELAKSLKRDPRSCIRPFFAKFKNPEPEYHRAFNDELSSFRERIRNRAQERIKEAVAQYEAEEREKRLGPGGLDPLEVIETLPPKLRECFESKQVDMLKTVLMGMDSKDVDYHMKRCVDSGLWIEDANAAQNKASDNGSDELPAGDDTESTPDVKAPSDDPSEPAQTSSA